jgi:predicted nucleic acid-binding protein
VIVFDASAMAEALIGRDADIELLNGLTGEVSAPHLLDVEVLSVLRALLRAGKLEPARAEDARRDHFDFTITRHEVQPLVERVWELRHRFTSYDACYLALAEALDAPLFTCDAKLDSGGHSAEVRVFPRTHSR